MKRTISFLLFALVVVLMAGCSTETNKENTAESVSVNMIPIFSHAKLKAETGYLNLSVPFRDFYFLKGWSSPYEEGEDKNPVIATVGKEATLRFNVYNPADRWLVFKVKNDGKYGGPDWQEMQVFSKDNLLGKYEIKKEQQEIRVHIPGNLQVAGENILTFKFAILWDNPIWMGNRDDHAEFPFPYICTYFSNMRFRTENSEWTDDSKVKDETEAFKLIVDDKYLSQTPSSEISYAFEIHPDTTLNLAGTVQSEMGDDETIAFEVNIRTDAEQEWKKLWNKDVVFKNGSVTESIEAAIDLKAYSGQLAEIKLSAISSEIIPKTTVVWKTLDLDVKTSPARKDNQSASGNIKDKAKNVVIIVLDAARWDRYGIYGSDLQATLNIDEFAKDALVFENSVATAPYTITSVSSLFSGLLPETHGVRRISQVFPSELESMPKAFRKNGYYALCLSGSKFITPQFGLASDFDQVVPMRKDEYKEAQVTTQDENAIRKGISDAAKSGKPLFMYAHFLPPHWPYRPPAPYDSFYTKGDKVKMRKAWMVKSALDYDLIPPDNNDIYTYERRYFNNLRYGDHVVKVVLDELKTNGLFEDSIVIITADHGEAFGEHKQFGHNTTVFEQMIRIPMAVKVPGTKAGRIVNPVGLIDIFPTLVELMGLEIESVNFQGRSLASLFVNGEESPRDDYYYARTNSYNYYFMMRGERYKYIHAEFQEYMFDLKNDPEEKNNIIDQHPALAATLRMKGLMMISVNEKSGQNIGKEAELTDEDEEELKNLGYLQ